VTGIGALARRVAGVAERFLLEAPGGRVESGPAVSPARLIGRPGPGSAPPAPAVMFATALGRGGGAASLAAAVGVAAADHAARGVLVVDIDPPARGRGPTVLASDAARGLEDRVRALGDPYRAAAARGRICYLPLGREDGAAGSGDRDDADPLALVAPPLAADVGASAAIVHLPPFLWPRAIADPRLRARSALIRAELPADRHLAALAVGELRALGLRVKVASRPLGMVASRRALAGVDPGGAASQRAARLASALVPAPASSGA
jgi:hypothetical protein